uniref:Uncharacterized protein n=1 Tax=Haptolina brevifila TaxID=156173 RepID=A0A7S2C0M1_9EUKA|mmetsp:Transcript_18816/g.38251  ORF Transcript_18816/g.38251 Transcript_18816/m.38251 type:complete len:318 (+) Transcript_18816:498-1451(+)
MSTARVKVTLRQISLMTEEGEPLGEPSCDGTYTSFDFDTEMLLPLTNPATVLHIQVLNGSALLGQWFMTTKYLYVAPTHCKHSALKVHDNGALTGTFLLCDAKLHGSAVRALGPHDMGPKGYCGEIDMGIHWVHTPELNMEPQAETRIATEQLNEGTCEDKLRLGNFGQLRTLLTQLPIRLDIHQMTLRDLNVRMKDIFTGTSAVASAGKKQSEDPLENLREPPGAVHVEVLDFSPFDQVTLYDFVDQFAKQTAARVLFNSKSIGSALGEIFGGLSQNFTHAFGSINSGKDSGNDQQDGAPNAANVSTATGKGIGLW